MRLLEGRTANEAWSKAAAAFLVEGEAQEQASRAGPTREILHAAFAIRNPLERWVLARRPTINPAFAIAETVWILAGRDDSALPNHWNPELPKYTGPGERYHGAYGHRLRRRFGLDQLERAYIALKNKPDSRQVVLQLWDPKIDLPDEEGRPAAQDVPCNVLSMLKVRKGRLEWAQVMCSNDLFRGVPYTLQLRAVHCPPGGDGRLAKFGGRVLRPPERQPARLRRRFRDVEGVRRTSGDRPEHGLAALAQGGVGPSLRRARRASGCDDRRPPDGRAHARAVKTRRFARSLQEPPPHRCSGLGASEWLDRPVRSRSRRMHQRRPPAGLGRMVVEDRAALVLP